MGSIKFIIIILVITAGVGVFSKPDDQALKELFYQQTLNDIKNVGINKDDNLLSGAFKVACMLSAEDCAKNLVDNQLNLEIQDYFAFKLANIKSESESSMCVGVFNTWKCF